MARTISVRRRICVELRVAFGRSAGGGGIGGRGRLSLSPKPTSGRLGARAGGGAPTVVCPPVARVPAPHHGQFFASALSWPAQDGQRRSASGTTKSLTEKETRPANRPRSRSRE